MWTIKHFDGEMRSCWDDMWGVYKPDMTDAVVRDKVWDKLNDPAKSVYGVFILSSGVPIGFAHYVVMETTSAPEPELYIQDLYITKHNRGMKLRNDLNVGCDELGQKVIKKSLLVEWFKDEGRRLGCSKITFKTRADNDDARSIYKKICPNEKVYMSYAIRLRLG